MEVEDAYAGERVHEVACLDEVSFLEEVVGL